MIYTVGVSVFFPSSLSVPSSLAPLPHSASVKIRDWLSILLLGKDLETNNEATAVAMHRRGKQASTTIKLLLEMVLCNPLLNSCSSWTATMETDVFSTYVARVEDLS
jgi:hypothetical protein